MNKLLLLALVLAACDEKPLPPPPGDDTPSESSGLDDPPPLEDEDDGARNLSSLPVSLPKVERAFRLTAAPTFVVITAKGDISVGMFDHGFRARAGTVVKVDKIAETLARLAVDNIGPGAGPVALRAVTSGPIETLALADENATAEVFVPALRQVAQRRTAIGVNVNNGRGRLAYITGSGIVRGAPVHIEVTESGVSIYGAAQAWGDVGAALEDLVATHKRASSMSVLADLSIAPSTPVERIVRLLYLLAAAGITEAQLSIDAALAPVRPAGVYVTQDGSIPSVSIGQPNAQGDLDKAIIRRYIKRNIQKITYCYEKQLLASPGLSGTVVVQFFISPLGKVAQSSASGVQPDVARCVADVVRQIEFPRPKGGGGVQVNYPFTFRPDGG